MLRSAIKSTTFFGTQSFMLLAQQSSTEDYIYRSLQNITLQKINYYMSGTFVTKFSLFPISNKVFHTSKEEQTNVSNEGDV